MKRGEKTKMTWYKLSGDIDADEYGATYVEVDRDNVSFIELVPVCETSKAAIMEAGYFVCEASYKLDDIDYLYRCLPTSLKLDSLDASILQKAECVFSSGHEVDTDLDDRPFLDIMHSCTGQFHDLPFYPSELDGMTLQEFSKRYLEIWPANARRVISQTFNEITYTVCYNRYTGKYHLDRLGDRISGALWEINNILLVDMPGTAWHWTTK